MATIRTNPRSFNAKEVAQLLDSDINHLNVALLRRCLNDRGKIYSSRKNSVPAKVQRRLRRVILRARYLALLPYAPDHNLMTTTLTKQGKAASESKDGDGILTTDEPGSATTDQSENTEN